MIAFLALISFVGTIQVLVTKQAFRQARKGPLAPVHVHVRSRLNH